MSLIKGLHHVTALCSNAQKNIDFYAGVLGLRMVKKTINFDAPDVYHLYYGDNLGTPGTIMTFFPFDGMQKGRKGKGQLTVTSFSVPDNSLDYWMKRLDKFKVPYKDPQERFDEVFLYLEDNDGLGLELVATSKDKRQGYAAGPVSPDQAVKGFYSVTLTEEGYERTAGLLTNYLDHGLVIEKGNRFRFAAGYKKKQRNPVGFKQDDGLSTNGQGNLPEDQGNESQVLPGAIVDILCTPDSMRASSGSGTVHHVAFAVKDDAEQLSIRKKLISGGFDVTPVIDRQYFHSIYFREPGGVLFEVATSDIGFTYDESEDHLGESLKLPSWVEPQRQIIESGLVLVEVNMTKYGD